MYLCDDQCQSDLLRYLVIYWVLLLPLWLAGVLLMTVLYLLGKAYQRWPIAIGGTVMGITAAITTYGLWTAAVGTRAMVTQDAASTTSQTAPVTYIAV